jgi:GntR family transcriptional regulator
VIDRTSGVAVYRQVADQIRVKIQSGELAPGALLPSERELVEQLGVSRPTVQQAIKFLRAQGVVVAEHGRGVFVRQPRAVKRLARNRVSQAESPAGFTPSVSVRVRFEPADERTAKLLRIEPGAEVTVRARQMRTDNTVVQVALSRLPREITRGTQLEDISTGQGGIYARLEAAGYALDHFTEVVSARMPTPDEQSQLQLLEGTPVIVVTRVTHTANGPVEVNDMILAADRYELLYELPAD